MSERVVVKLTNLLGEQVGYREFSSNIQNFREIFTFEESGFYVLSVRSNNQMVSQKVVINEISNNGTMEL